MIARRLSGYLAMPYHGLHQHCRFDNLRAHRRSGLSSKLEVSAARMLRANRLHRQNKTSHAFYADKGYVLGITPPKGQNFA